MVFRPWSQFTTDAVTTPRAASTNPQRHNSSDFHKHTETARFSGNGHISSRPMAVMRLLAARPCVPVEAQYQNRCSKATPRCVNQSTKSAIAISTQKQTDGVPAMVAAHDRCSNHTSCCVNESTKGTRVAISTNTQAQRGFPAMVTYHHDKWL